ncbi:MAG: hypothetical protein ACYC2H_12020 [Thermoplasmatota archaeon]
MRLPMLRILIASLVTLAALSALTPSASAVAICSTQQDVQDLDLDDSWLVRSQCTTENVISYDCDTDVRVYSDGTVYRSARCEPIICSPCSCYCPPPMESTSAASSPCTTVGNPALDGGFGVSCTAGPATCSAATATFGTIKDFLSPDAGCNSDVGLCEVGPQVVDGHKERLLLECQGFIQCVTEPCPGSGGIKI